jgi:drug/metabolite transporter (DMT)-like permease
LRLRGNLILMTAAFIWGTTFVAQQSGMDSLGPFTYAASRFFLGLLTLFCFLIFYRKNRQAHVEAGTYKSGWRVGIIAGFIMFTASSFQQVGMVYTTAGKAAFITCLYIMLVPLGAVFLRKTVQPENWAGALFGLMGLYLLCVRDGFSIGYGDTIVFVCALFWTAHILFIDAYASTVDVIEMATAQVAVCFVMSFIAAVSFEEIVWSSIAAEWFPVFYGGVMSVGIAFTLQIVGQKYAEPSHAALIMSLESVFGALSGWLLLHEVMQAKEISGCLLMVLGMIITQLGGLRKKKSFQRRITNE